MLHPIEVNNLALERNNEMLAEALVRYQFKVVQPSTSNNQLKRLGYLLMALGHKLKGEAAIEAQPVLHLK